MATMAVRTSLVLMAVFGLRPCSSSSPSSSSSPAFPAELTWDLYRTVSHLDPDANSVLCPVSVAQLLAQIRLGARGTTLQQLQYAMGTGDVSEEMFLQQVQRQVAAMLSPADGEMGPKLEAASAMFIQEGFPVKEGYKQISRMSLFSAIQSVNFMQPWTAARVINSWVEDQTSGKIQQLFSGSDFSPFTRLALVSAVYFKGSWQHRFPIENTALGGFTKRDGSLLQVPMMYQKIQANIGYVSHKESEVKLLELPFAGGESSLVVVLPDSAQTLSQLEQDLTEERLHTWLSLTQPEEVEVSLPRFQVHQRVALEGVLQSLNITEIFDPACDLSGIAGAGELHVSSAYHQSFIKVNEEGSEAAAAAGAAAAVIMSLQSHRFMADHPFLFLIRHKPTGSTLFIGRMMQPEVPVTRGRDSQAL